MSMDSDGQESNHGHGPGPSSAEPPGRRQRRQAEIRERLVRSAFLLFAERGFNATTVEDITNLADVGKGTFFNYFPSKEYIFAARVEGQMEKIQRFAAQTCHSTEPMDELLYRLAVSLTGDAGSSPAMLHSILVAVFSNESVRGIMADGLEKGRKFLEELIVLRQQRGEIRDDLAAGEITLGFQRALLGTVFLWSLAPSKPLADCLREMSNIVWSAIRRRST
jgi:AcrR family transcriptional regulator